MSDQSSDYLSPEDRFKGRAELVDKAISTYIAQQFQVFVEEHRAAVGPDIPLNSHEFVEPITQGVFTALLRFAYSASAEDTSIERLADNLREVASVYLARIASFDKPGALWREMHRVN